MVAREVVGTSCGTTINILQACLGPGLLALPYALRVIGLAGLALQLLASVLSVLAAAILVSCIIMLEQIDERGYGGGTEINALVAPTHISFKKIFQRAVGPSFGVLVEAMVFLVVTTIQISSALLFPQYLHTVIVDWTHEGYWAADRKVALLVTYIPCVALCCLRHLETLRVTSLMGNVVMLFTVVSIIVSSARAGPAHDIKAFQTPDVDFFAALPIFVFTVGFHTNVPGYYAELKGASLPRFMTIVVAAIGLGTVMNMATGAMGYLHFGDATESNILLNYKASDTQFTVARLLLTICTVCIYPLAHNAARTAFMNIVGLEPTNTAIAAIAVAHTTLVFFLAYWIHSLGAVLSFTGGLVSILVYIGLPVAYLRILHTLRSLDPVASAPFSKWKILVALVPTWGCIMVTCSVAGAVHRLS